MDILKKIMVRNILILIILIIIKRFLGKVLKLDVIILLKNVIENDFDYYLQVYLEECKYKND